jgi:hypothetical protein
MPARLQKKVLRWLVFITIPIVLFAVVKLARWHNDPNIHETERAARRKLGLQIYGALDCGVVEWGNHLSHSFKSPLFGDDNRETIRKAAHQHENRKPFIYIVKFWKHEYWKEYTVIMGTRIGEVHEFQQIDARGDYGMDRTIIPEHRKWKKPTVQKKGNDILFFDAGQKPK